jgi:MHS family citrate/tricarballylate:H+ symporter-like MFS transporter
MPNEVGPPVGFTPIVTTATAPPTTPACESTTVAIKPIIQVAAGNALEIYDFMIYGYYARYIAQTFFPSSNEYLSLMLALMTFAFGFLARPVGAIVLGSYTDRHGRRKGLILTLTLMSVGIISVACTPSYATIGIAAPLIVLVAVCCRASRPVPNLAASLSIWLKSLPRQGARSTRAGRPPASSSP